MARYVTNFKLKSAVNDFGAAKKYLADADMTKYLIDDLRDYENMPELADKIVHIEWNLEEDWYGTINLETTEDISKQDLAVILEWVKGQNSDGLGEGFEQRNFARFYDEKRGRYYLASFMRRLPQFTKVSDSHKVTDSEDDNIKSVTMRFGDFLNWYFNINVGNVDADFLYKNDWDYLASGNGLSLDEVADIFNENYDTQVEFTQYDIGNAKVIDWDLNDIGFEADSMDWLPGLEEVSDSRRIKDENNVEDKAYLVKQLYEDYLRIDTALREMEQGASYYEQEIFLNKGINDLRKNISGVDPRTEKMFSYGLLRLDTALREMEQGASYYEQEVFLNEGMQSIFDAIQTLEYE